MFKIDNYSNIGMDFCHSTCIS